MNAPFIYTNAISESTAEDVRALEGIIEAAQAVIDAKRARAISKANWALLDFHKSLVSYCDGNDPQELLDESCNELGVDEGGNPVDENGCPVRTFNPSRVHPDDPVQAGGWV
jgi:hypothetical protein